MAPGAWLPPRGIYFADTGAGDAGTGWAFARMNDAMSLFSCRAEA